MNRLSTESGPPRALFTVSLIIIGAAMISSCVSAPDNSGSPATSTENPENGIDGSLSPEETVSPIATSLSSATPEGENLRFDIFSLERHSEELLVLSMRVTNTGNEKARVFQTLASSDGHGTTPNGVSLIDMQNNRRYFPFTLTDGKTCHCSDWDGQQNLAPDDSIDIWAAFPSPPSSIKTVTVTTPITPDFLDIPIIDSPSPNPDVSGTPVSEPLILDLQAFQDDLDGDSSRTESAEETSILLSSDVLFDLNKATLTEEAEEVLRNVAEEIDAASDTTIQVDGYTDNTGNDAVNIPLSEERAETVATQLGALVTRDDIAFKVSGHGATDPVGDNSTEEGRAKNRRVTITFTK